jgi:nicotinamide-nucleotide amidase
MRVELINTGSELMLGFTVNSHLSYIARKLTEVGLRLDRQTAVGDDRAAIRAAIAEALQRTDILLVTGGLGPTSDDFTREVVAELLGRQLVRDDAIAGAIADRFQKRGIPMPERVLVQSLVPVGAQVLPNPNGTAPGLALEQAGKLIVLLPGPPRELNPLFDQYVLPVLRHRFGDQSRFECRVFRVVGLAESLVEEKVAPALADLPGIELGYSAKMGEVEVRVITPAEVSGATTPEVVGRVPSRGDEAERRVREALGDSIYGTGDDRLEEVVIEMLIEAGKTIAVAESCTGGIIANRLTNVSGASNVFLAGYVAYSNEAKVRVLGVKEDTLRRFGAVSKEVAYEMVAGARQRSGADFALSTTGIAGPTGGTPEKPVGLVYIGFATPGRIEVKRHMLLFDRETFKFFASQYALDAVRRELLGEAR